MKICLLGYGKMGKEVEQVALERGHEVLCKLDAADEVTQERLQGADVAIEFTMPEAAVANIRACFHAQVPVVVGTTGWYNQYPSLVDECRVRKGAMLAATNFSIGVNILFHINEVLAKLMAHYPDYSVRVDETHHTQKLDAPSGTAVTLAEGILEQHPKKSRLLPMDKGQETKPQPEELPVISERKGDVKGFHEVTWTSEIDQLRISHEAFSRKGFALGAVLAAEWLQNKQGVYTMKDVINR